VEALSRSPNRSGSFGGSSGGSFGGFFGGSLSGSFDGGDIVYSRSKTTGRGIAEGAIKKNEASQSRCDASSERSEYRAREKEAASEKTRNTSAWNGASERKQAKCCEQDAAGT
jgi:hypothetical protein